MERATNGSAGSGLSTAVESHVEAGKTPAKGPNFRLGHVAKSSLRKLLDAAMLGLLCQSQPRLRHVHQQVSALGINDLFCNP